MEKPAVAYRTTVSWDHLGVSPSRPTGRRGGTGTGKWVRFAGAAVLLFAAGQKLLQASTTPAAPGESVWVRWGWLALIAFEAFGGLWLCSNAFPRLTRAASVLLFGVFGAVAAYRGLRGEASCGCFGEVKVNPWLTCVLDLTLAWGFLLVRGGPALAGSSRRGWWVYLAAGGAVLALAGVVTVQLAHRPRLAVVSADGEIAEDAAFVLLEPDKWKGRPLPLARHIDIGDRLTRGRWQLLFVRRGCPKCEEALRQLKAPAPSRAGADPAPWAVIELPSPESQAPPPSQGEPGTLTFGRLAGGKTWIGDVPFVVVLADGVVVEVEDRPAHAP